MCCKPPSTFSWAILPTNIILGFVQRSQNVRKHSSLHCPVDDHSVSSSLYPGCGLDTSSVGKRAEASDRGHLPQVLAGGPMPKLCSDGAHLSHQPSRCVLSAVIFNTPYHVCVIPPWHHPTEMGRLSSLFLVVCCHCPKILPQNFFFLHMLQTQVYNGIKLLWVPTWYLSLYYL